MPPPTDDPKPLRDIAVDLVTNLGADAAVTPVGLATLENLLGGGLRQGDFLAVSGDSGVGKSALGVFIAYIAARSGAGTLVASATLTESEVLARLAARALHREHPNLRITYGQIASGAAWRDAEGSKHARAAVDTVLQKVGARLHVEPARPFGGVDALRERAQQLSHRFDRVMLFIDGIEALSAESRDVVHVAYELRAMAALGTVVLATVQTRDRDAVSPAATLMAELRRSAAPSVARLADNVLALGARNVELVVTKNTNGPTGIIPLRFIAGAATFEERAP